MKEYTLKEVLDKFERNPNLKFKFVLNEDYRTEDGVAIRLDNFSRVVSEDGEPILSNFTLKDRFVLLNQSVDKITAFKAFARGKTIWCGYDENILHYEPMFNCSSPTVMENIENQEPVSVEEILYGKWFIEED